MKKIYIAGKVTGEPIHSCALKFAMAQKEIEALGFEAVNPIEVVGDFKSRWAPAMKKCIKAMMDCDALFILPCAKGSKGAKIEKNLAFDLKIPVYQTLDILKALL
jgi:hypothetical protein